MGFPSGPAEVLFVQIAPTCLDAVGDNLVTLRATCHDGLDPHYDPDLFRSIGLDPTAYLHRSDPAHDAAAVRRYRLGVLNALSESTRGARR